MKRKNFLAFLLLLVCLIIFPTTTKALSDVFIDGISGNDMNSGTSPSQAVQSFSQAKALLSPGGTIWVTKEIDITTDETWDLSGYGSLGGLGVIKRWDGVSVPFVLPADTNPYKGRLIYVADGVKLTLNNLILDGNKANVTAVANGSIIQTTGDLSINNCVLKDNKAPTTGIAINSRITTAYRPKIEINNSFFNGNEGTSTGSANGTISYDKGQVIIDNTVFDGNYNAVSGVITSAFKSGITDKDLVVTNSQFINNTGDRGGLSIDTYDDITVTNTLFDSNTSSSSTNYFNGNIKVTFTNVTMSNNTALNGGGIYLTNSALILNLNNCLIEDNTVTNRGGGIFFNNGKLYIKDSIIRGNESTSVGAGIYFNGYGVLGVEGTNTIFDNVGANVHGDVYIPSNKYITVTGDLTSSKIGVFTAAKPTATTNPVVAVPDTAYVLHDDIFRQFIGDEVRYATDNETYLITNNRVVLTNAYAITYDYTTGSYGGSSTEIGYAYKRNLTTADYHIPTMTGFDFDYYTDVSGVKIDDMTAEYIDSPRKYIAVYKRSDYDVSFTTMFGGIITGTNKRVPYEGFTPGGVTASTISLEYDFIGWSYDYTAADGSHKSGTVLDYTTVPIYGDVTFNAIIVKKPFVSVITSGNGVVSISKLGSMPTLTFDSWAIDTTLDPLPVNAVLSFEADPGYKLDDISFVDLYGNSHVLDITTSDPQTFTVGVPSKTVTLIFDESSGEVNISDIETTLKFTVSYDLPKEYITFDVNGVSYSMPFYIGSSVTRPFDPVLSGYMFMGWYTDPAFTTLYDFTTPVTTSFTLYAKFDRIPVNPDTADVIGKWVSLFVGSSLLIATIYISKKRTLTIKLK